MGFSVLISTLGHLRFKFICNVLLNKIWKKKKKLIILLRIYIFYILQAASKSSLRFHLTESHEELCYKCKKCDYKSTTYGALARHMRSIHIGEKFPCNLCDYEATQKSNLKTHITRVHGMQNNVCKFCKAELDNRIDLENHVISVHEKDFQVCAYENCLYRAKTKVVNIFIFLCWTYEFMMPGLFCVYFMCN